MDKNKVSIDRATLTIFWRAVLKDKHRLGIVLLYPLGTVFLSTLAPLYIGKILASLARAGHDTNHLIFIFMIIGVLGLLSNRVGFTALMELQARTMNYLQTQAFSMLMGRSVGFHNNNIAGKLVSDALDFPQAFSMLSNAAIVNILPLVISLVVGIAIVFSASIALGLIVLVMAVFTVGSSFLESRRRAPLRKRRLAAMKATTGHLADTIVNAQTVKTFAREDLELDQHKNLGGTLLDMRLSDWRRAAITGNNRMATLLALQFVYILLVTAAIHRDPSLLGIGIFAFSFTITLSNRLFDMNSLIRNIEDGFLQASPITEFMQEEPEILDEPQAKDLKVRKGGIEFKDVNFHYQDNKDNQAVFEDLNLDIAPGEKIGLVGPSGGGKSTLTRLLLRFEDISQGSISIDGQNIAQVTQASLRNSISYVPQEPLLFHRPVADNIAYGKLGATPKQIKQAAESANADGFIEQLPLKYRTVVGERGVKLSGGQRQRVAIARAILKDAPILVLDEATSALDSESEKLIQKALWKLMEGRTAIVIAHRLSTIQKMDRIIVLDEGKIVEQGSHRVLLDKKGTYARLWSHQSGGFLEE